jgi:hypothetical protein
MVDKKLGFNEIYLIGGPNIESLEMDKEATLFVDITQGAVKSALSTVDDLTTDAV